jgi:hypothetical protein
MDFFGFLPFSLGNKVLWQMEQSNEKKIKEKKNETIMEEPTMEKRFEDYPSLQIKTNKIPKNEVEKLFSIFKNCMPTFFWGGPQ